MYLGPASRGRRLMRRWYRWVQAARSYSQSCRKVPITRSQMPLARGARTGVFYDPGALCGEDGVE